MSKIKNQDLDNAVPLDEAGDDEAVRAAIKVSLIVLSSLMFVAAVGYSVYFFAFQGKKEIEEVEQTKKARTRETVASIPKIKFTDITEACGIDFKHTNGDTGKKLLPQTMGGGVAFLDYDNDGDQDLFFVNSNYWPGDQPESDEPPTMAMYANDGKGNFRNTTKEVGLDVSFYGMGVAVGDYDGDGWRDLFVTAVGKNFLFKNDKGKFVDATEMAKVAGRDEDWGSSCGFFDYDNDGNLDLFVCNYVDWTADKELELGVTLTGQVKGYVTPQIMAGAFPYLYKNNGDGTFSDVSEESLVQIVDKQNQRPLNKSLGLSFVDINGDGWQDIFVANDTVRNLLFINQKDGTFSEQGELANIAYDHQGGARGAMGIDVARFRADESLGFIIGNFALEPASLYVKQGKATIFTDEALATGLGPETRVELTFGMFFFDYDLDGRLDILTANGHLEEEIQLLFKTQTYKQSPHLFWNAGEDQRSEFVTVDKALCGEDLCVPMVGRGLTYADIDADGDLDVVITSVNEKPRVLRNDQTTANHWLQIKLVGDDANLDALGSKIVVHCGNKQFERMVTPTRSYLSQTQIPVSFGLGELDRIDFVEVTWPDGLKQEIKDVQIDQALTIKKK